MAFTSKDLVNTKRRIEQFIRPVVGSVKLSRLTAKQVRDFHNDRANTPARLRTRKGEEQKFRSLEGADARRRRRATANRDLTVLKAALNYALGNGKIATDAAWKTVKPFKGVDGARLRYLSDDESRRIVNAVRPEFRPVVQAALLTGARWGELRRMTVQDVDLQAATVRLQVTKGSTPRDCFLEAEGLALFAVRAAGKGEQGASVPLLTGRRGVTQRKSGAWPMPLPRRSSILPPASTISAGPMGHDLHEPGFRCR